MLIAETVIRNGRATIDELQELAGVSAMTVYRDVAALEERGILQRDRGRVVAVASDVHEADAEFRLEQSSDEKLAVARMAAEHIRPGSSIMLDDSTTAVCVLRAIGDLSEITIVTNSLLVAREVTSTQRASKLFVVGGEYQAWAQALTGPSAVAELRSMSVEQCLISASGIANMGCCHPNADVAEVKRAMIDSAERPILLLEHTKFERRALHRFADLREFAHVVVDERIPEPLRDDLLAADVPLSIARVVN